ncbi:MAG TPA: hypothetical protein VF021_08550 [Longimicrobiales bacterium]
MALPLLSGGCSDTSKDSALGIDATGSVLGVAFLDRNGNGLLDLPADGPFPGVAVEVVPRAGGSAVARGISNAVGGFALRDVPVGDYQVRVDPATLPDSVQLVKIDSLQVRVVAADSVPVVVMLSYPALSVAAARALPAGRRVFVEGVTLNAWVTFGDSTLHVADSTGAIRATRVLSGAVATGTRVRVLGTTELRDGQPTITDVTVVQLGSGQVPPPLQLSTGRALSADSGKADAALARVVAVPIVGTQVNAAGDFVVSTNDGGGLLDVVLDRNSGISSTGIVPGALLTATGVLVPAGTAGAWQLKPRTTSDLSVTFQAVTVAQARALQVGRVVTIDGVALNSWFTFGDSTVHVADSTGTIRAFRVAPVNLLAGDRVRLLGTIATRDGQPVLANVSASVLGQGVLPLPQPVSTAKAATADSARLDAALVKISSAVITDTASVAGDFILRVNDSSGVLDVVLDGNAGFALAPFVKGAVLDVTGLLVTSQGGRDWRLKPRQQSDVVVR